MSAMTLVAVQTGGCPETRPKAFPVSDRPGSRPNGRLSRWTAVSATEISAVVLILIVVAFFASIIIILIIVPWRYGLHHESKAKQSKRNGLYATPSWLESLALTLYLLLLIKSFFGIMC